MFFVNFSSALLIFISAAIYIFCSPRWRWLYLLGLSLVLLINAAPYGFLIAAAQTAGAYWMGFWVARTRAKVWTFWVCVIAQLLPLLSFRAIGAGHWLVPLGLSYYTFQLLSYLIEIQWGRLEPEKQLARFASYNLCFANKIAGPIERPDLLRQMVFISTPDGKRLFRSAMWIWLGLFQKFVLADNLAEYVNPVFQYPENYSGLTTTLAVLMSKYQIFCDFSGISLIALGIGGLFGLELGLNFRRPFAATSVRDFWSRWHISLQTWIRDYVYFPLLATPLARFGVLPVLMVTFVLFGLWHDWRWTFVAYGILQALLVKYEPSSYLKKMGRPFLVVFNYCILICLPSVLFRAQTFGEAWNVWRNMGLDVKNWSFFLDLGTTRLATVLALVIAHEILQWAEFKHELFARLARAPWGVKMALAIVLLMTLIVYSKFDPQSVFIYSQF